MGTDRGVNPVRIIGIDPGSRVTGYGIIESIANRQRVVAYGCIRTDEGTASQRLLQIQNELAAVLNEHRPDEAAVEEVFVKRNVAAAIVLGQARGVAICTVARDNLTIAEYAPAQVKLAVTGNGRAEKQQVQQMVKILLKLNEIPATDAADALAVALCHAHHRGVAAAMARALA